MSDMPDEVLIDRDMGAWPRSHWSLLGDNGAVRYILTERQTAPKVLRLTVNGEDVYYEPRSATEALLALLAEEKKRAEQAEAERDQMRDAVERLSGRPYWTVLKEQEALSHD